MTWQTQSIQSFCRTGSGGTPSRKQVERYYGGEIPWVKSGELGVDEVTSTSESITEEALAESSVKWIPQGALLVAMYGATVGKVARLGIDATSNQAVCHVIPDPNVADSRFLFYALRRQAPRWIEQRVGGAQPNISQGIIRVTMVPLPPLPEQRRIAAILDQADAVRRARREAIGLTEELLRSVFLEMFGDPVVNPRGWPTVPVGSVVDQTQYGTSSKANSEREGLPVLRMNNITKSGRIDVSSLKWCPIEPRELDKFTVRRGDLLFNRTNSPALVGKTAVWDRDDVYAFAGYLIRVRFDEEKVLPEYVSAFLNSTYGKRYLFVKAKPSNNMSKFSASLFRTIPVPLPPTGLQLEFRTVLGEIERQRSRLLSELSDLNVLFSSLLQRAFRGEL